MREERRVTAAVAQDVTASSNKPFEEVILAVESSGPWEEFEQRTERSVGESGFVIFARVDHGAWMSLVPHEMKGKMYVIGNPLIAR